jgi:hypothetical protein
MVLLVGDSRCYEEDDCACLHTLVGVPNQEFSDGLRLNLRGKALKSVPISFQSYVIDRMDGEPIGGCIQ